MSLVVSLLVKLLQQVKYRPRKSLLLVPALLA
ncbi:Uncharacterised protein [Vibrio cholerae]|nr:Uncharacterised protein [Vibrio cholerae]